MIFFLIVGSSIAAYPNLLGKKSYVVVVVGGGGGNSITTHKHGVLVVAISSRNDKYISRLQVSGESCLGQNTKPYNSTIMIQFYYGEQ